jgi:transketolase
MRKTPGVDISTGSLGQGLSMANGMALAAKIDKKDYKVFAILGDGECQEGQVWEAAMASAHYKLDNLIAFVDRNQLQIDGSTKEVMALEPFVDKWKAFGWNVQIINGHNMAEIGTAIDKASKSKGKPNMIIANTVKGKGVSFMECSLHFHGNAPNEDELRKALEELK